MYQSLEKAFNAAVYQTYKRAGGRYVPQPTQEFHCGGGYCTESNNGGFKVERTCARCRVRAYHRGNDMGVRHRISCVNGGHVWAGRIRLDEMF